MQFEVSSVDPPASGLEMALGLLVLMGTLAGLVCLARRLARWRVAAHDPLVWLSGVILGLAFGAVSNDHVTFLLLLLIGAAMSAASWVAVRHSGQLRMVGLRILETAALASVVAALARHR